MLSLNQRNHPTSFLWAALVAGGLTTFAGCASNHPVSRVESPVNVTHEVAFGDYRRVFNTTYHILNRYGVVQTSSYRYGEIRALIGEDTSLFQKTRREIEARIVDAGDYWDVQCRVLIKIEDSEVATFSDQYNPLYDWKTVASDPRLEARLNNEIRAALSGGAWEAKAPLRPEPRVPYERLSGDEKAHRARAKGASKKAKSKRSKSKKAAPAVKPSSDDTDEVAHHADELAHAATSSAFERLGILRMQRNAFDDAAKAFRAAARSRDGHLRAHFLLAQAELSQGDYPLALEQVRVGLRHNPAWVGSDLDLRDLYIDQATFDRVHEGLARAAAKDDSLQFLLGFVRFHAGEGEGALVAFDRHLAQNPEDTVARGYRERARERVDASHGLENF